MQEVAEADLKKATKELVKELVEEGAEKATKELAEKAAKETGEKAGKLAVVKTAKKPLLVKKEAYKFADEVTDILRKKFPTPSKEPWPVHNYSEIDAYNKALKDGANPKKLEMHTVKIDKKTGTISDYGRCENCRTTTKDIDIVTSE